jgi:hypothetical protein
MMPRGDLTKTSWGQWATSRCGSSDEEPTWKSEGWLTESSVSWGKGAGKDENAELGT